MTTMNNNMNMNVTNKIFDLQTAALSPYEAYHIGNTFHNNNGEDYIIINISAERDKALLAKKLDEKESKIVHSPALFIGAKGLRMNDWSYGHYFMADFEAAVKWFMTDDTVESKPEKKLVTVQDFLNMYHEEDSTEYHIYNFSNYVRFYSVKDIPEYLKHAELNYFSVFGTFNSADGMKFPYSCVTLVLTDDVVILEP